MDLFSLFIALSAGSLSHYIVTDFSGGGAVNRPDQRPLLTVAWPLFISFPKPDSSIPLP